MVYVEQVRQLASEQNLINDPTTYTHSGGWGTMRNYGNITLSEDSLLVFTFETTLTSAYRLKIGSLYVWGGNTPGVFTGIAYVAAGSYAVIMENAYGPGSGDVKNFQLGKAKLSDQVGSVLASYSAEIDLTVAQRSPPSFFGTLKKAVFAVLVWSKTTGGQTNFENVGDSLTNGVDLAVDGIQVSWTARTQDPSSYETAYAIYYCSLSVAVSHSFVITKDNAATTVHISILGCPWLLATIDNEPMTLDFSQNSTFYLVLEPLNADPTKNSKIGKVRAVTYGDATDYYSVATGTGILSHTYTFELVEVNSISVVVNGFGGCISLIGVDER